MTPAALAAFAGLLLSAAVTYIPGVAAWYDGQDAPTKALVFAGLVFVAAGLSFGASCIGLDVAVLAKTSCTYAGFQETLNAFIFALMGGATGYVSFRNLRPNYAKSNKVVG